MGAGDSNKVPRSKIQTYSQSIFQVSKSICKITTPRKQGTGFLIKFFKGEENFFCLMSCEHIIKDELIEQKEKISFTYDNDSKEKEIILDKNERIIKTFKKDIDIDAAIVEIKKSDNIDEDYFLLPNISTIYDLSILNHKKIQIPQYLKAKGFSFSKGDIIKITNNQITHKASTEKSSSGSPLFIKDTTQVVGIHYAGNKSEEENYADAIGPIFFFIKNGFKFNI